MAEIDSSFPVGCVPVTPSVSGVAEYGDTLLPPRCPPKADWPKPELPKAGVVVCAPAEELFQQMAQKAVIKHT